ncbi:hypothetical protein DEV91_1383 [Phyllobacterium brassicacearum]|nr:hypothetical protein DEV91_1383 [Phyllobacterium brassicacearum]
MWTTHSAETAMQPHQRNGSAHVPAGTFRRSDVERYADLGCGSRIRIKELTSLQHCVHDHRKFTRHSHGGSFEAYPFPELKPPCPQVTLL